VSKRAKAPPPAAPPGPFHDALAGLAAWIGSVPTAPEQAVGPLPRKVAERAPPARAVVRMERAGRGGKIVTVVEKLDLPSRELESWLGDLKRALGCGGALEGGALVLQGDTRERVGAWLEKRGVRKVTVA
jgi:translation initiation factor 1